ncbi:CPBP family intramembrane glutamic endopeptidase [Actinorugispora endophytica]|uniref:CAAX prenyl protease 2/Lysostaphin resistance protein A-like domain-containing protein n=1 Tax=Actinorugispora endophytica TaxID=1605990 RepID=A0A4R6VCE6_9ACTN|nr:CPBP family intramembrane glutamic endopeptidase [Actinorugispora endophytica]TDQ54436.1 hypothetical protein EV190_102270 [Actinorugispora endophytica]
MTHADERAAPHRDPGIVSLLLRVALPVGVLGAGLLTATALGGDAPVTEVRTLVLRAVGGAAVSVAAVAVIVVLARFAHRRPLRHFGLTPPRDAWRALLSGALAWLVPASTAFAVLALFGAPLTATAPGPEFAGTAFLLLLAVLLSEAVPEEIVFRGYVTGALGERLPDWWTILAQSALFTGFALLLRGYSGLADLTMFAAMGIGLGYLRLATGSVWTTVGFHTAFQTGSQLVLTHGVLDFAGPPPLALLALGTAPFAVGAVLVSMLAPAYPQLFARRRQRPPRTPTGRAGPCDDLDADAPETDVTGH